MTDNVLAFRQCPSGNTNSDQQAIINQVVASLTDEGWPLREALLMARRVALIFEEKLVGF